METQLLSYFDITWQDTKLLSPSPTKSFPLEVHIVAQHISHRSTIWNVLFDPTISMQNDPAD